MREWLNIAIGIVLLSAFFTFIAVDDAYAEEKKQVYALPTINVCGSISSMISQLESDKYGERGFASASLYVRNSKTNQTMMGDLYVFINPETTDYTLLAVFVDDNLACILGTGEGFGPYSADIELEIDGTEM